MNRRCSSVPASPCAGRCSGLSQACCAASHAAGAAQVGMAAATLLTLLTCTREQRAGPRAGVADRASQRDGLCACFKRAPAPRCGWCRAAWQTRAPAARPGRACAVTPAAARAPRARWRPPAAAARRPRRRQSSTAAGAAARGWSACTARGRDHAGRRCAAAHAWSASSAGRDTSHAGGRRGCNTTSWSASIVPRTAPKNWIETRHALIMQANAKLARGRTSRTCCQTGSCTARREGIFRAEARHLRGQKAGRADIEALQSRSPCACLGLRRAALQPSCPQANQGLVSYSVG